MNVEEVEMNLRNLKILLRKKKNVKQEVVVENPVNRKKPLMTKIPDTDWVKWSEKLDKEINGKVKEIKTMVNKW